MDAHALSLSEETETETDLRYHIEISIDKLKDTTFGPTF